MESRGNGEDIYQRRIGAHTVYRSKRERETYANQRGKRVYADLRGNMVIGGKGDTCRSKVRFWAKIIIRNKKRQMKIIFTNKTNSHKTFQYILGHKNN